MDHTMELTAPGVHPGNLERAERWISVVGGGVLAVYGMTRRDRSGALLALMGGSLAWQGMHGGARLTDVLHAGNGAVADGAPVIEAEHAILVERPARDLYRVWRRLENLPRLMRQIESVLPLGGNRFRWTVRAPIGTVAWDAEIVHEREDELIAWRSLEGSEIDHAGSVHFDASPRGGDATEVRVRLAYTPPPGPMGQVLAKLFGEDPERRVADDLKRFKRTMEGRPPAAFDGEPASGRWW